MLLVIIVAVWKHKWYQPYTNTASATAELFILLDMNIVRPSANFFCVTGHTLLAIAKWGFAFTANLFYEQDSLPFEILTATIAKTIDHLIQQVGLITFKSTLLPSCDRRVPLEIIWGKEDSELKYLVQLKLIKHLDEYVDSLISPRNKKVKVFFHPVFMLL